MFPPRHSPAPTGESRFPGAGRTWHHRRARARRLRAISAFELWRARRGVLVADKCGCCPPQAAAGEERALRTSSATSWRQAPSRVSRGAGAPFDWRISCHRPGFPGKTWQVLSKYRGPARNTGLVLSARGNTRSQRPWRRVFPGARGKMGCFCPWQCSRAAPCSSATDRARQKGEGAAVENVRKKFSTRFVSD